MDFEGGAVESFSFFGLMCKAWRDAQTSPYMSSLAIAMSSTRLASAIAAGWKGDEEARNIAAGMGKSDVFLGCRKLGCKEGSEVLEAAVRSGDMEIVQAVLDDPDFPVGEDALHVPVASINTLELVGCFYGYQYPYVACL